MAEVHIGHDTRLGRTVAIKILRSDLARDPSFQARFRREAQAAASLNHPSIVAVYDTGEDVSVEPSGAVAHVPFIGREYGEGHSVRDILRDGPAGLDGDVRAGVVDGDDRGVVQRGGGLGLAAEAGLERGVAGQVGAQDLDRNGAAEAGVMADVDLGHDTRLGRTCLLYTSPS